MHRLATRYINEKTSQIVELLFETGNIDMCQKSYPAIIWILSLLVGEETVSECRCKWEGKRDKQNTKLKTSILYEMIQKKMEMKKNIDLRTRC